MITLLLLLIINHLFSISYILLPSIYNVNGPQVSSALLNIYSVWFWFIGGGGNFSKSVIIFRWASTSLSNCILWNKGNKHGVILLLIAREKEKLKLKLIEPNAQGSRKSDRFCTFENSISSHLVDAVWVVLSSARIAGSDISYLNAYVSLIWSIHQCELF